MDKFEFLYELSEKLSGIPEDDKQKSLEYYGELIDDAIEDGVLEEDAVKSLGSIDNIVNDVYSSLSLPKLIKAKIKAKAKTPAWQIPLIIFGALIIVPIFIVLLAGVFSVLTALWSLVLVIYAIDLSFALSAITIPFWFILGFLGAGWANNFLMISGCCFLAVLSIPFFYIGKAYTKLMLYTTKKTIIFIKKCFAVKEDK